MHTKQVNLKLQIMKHLFFILMVGLPFFTLANNESPIAPNFSVIAAAMSTGNAEALSKYFDEDVEVSLFDKEDTYDKAQATGLMRDFFTKNKPKSFSQMHQGASKGKDTQFSIGEIVTISGNYRVYIYMKIVNDNYLIQEVRIGKN